MKKKKISRETFLYIEKDLLATSIISFFSLFLSNGFNPIHFFICDQQITKKGVYGYLLLTLIHACINQTIVYPSVWFTFIAYICCMKIASKGICVNCAFFYLVTNTFCFFEMSLLYGYYPFSFTGYVACMLAGIPFAIRSFIASGLFYGAFSLKTREFICRSELLMQTL